MTVSPQATLAPEAELLVGAAAQHAAVAQIGHTADPVDVAVHLGVERTGELAWPWALKSF
jgi:hypothetical protein